MLVSWGMFGTLFKAVSWSMGYVILAKGDSKLFIKTAILFNSIFVTMLVLGYYFYGLLGVGIGFFIYYILHLVMVKLITFYKYDVYFNKNFNGLFLICLMLCSITFALSYIEEPFIKFSLMSLMVVISSIFTLHQLNKKVDIKAIIKKSTSKKDD
jgi:O-antigen/teichoic acid export membrane protein